MFLKIISLVFWAVMLGSSTDAEDIYDYIKVDWEESCDLLRGLCYNLTFPDLNKRAVFSATNSSVISIQKRLGLYESRLAFFPYDLFESIPWIEIDFKNSGIKQIEWKNFRKAELLERLTLSGNELVEIPNTIFSGAISLNFLNLARNEISQLFSQSFEGLKELQELYLQDNKIKELPLKIFDDLPELSHLDLSKNLLVSLDSFLFAKNKLLEIVYIKKNHLESLPLKLFSGLVKLFYVDVSRNKDLTSADLEIKSIHFQIRGCSLRYLKIVGSVMYLKVNNNRLESEKIHITNSSALKAFHLSNNSLEDLQFLKPFTNLDQLDLSHNPKLNLTNLDFNMSCLWSLGLRNTGLYKLPIFILKGSENITELDITANKISEIDPQNFKYLSNIKGFDFGENPWKCDNLKILMDQLIIPQRMYFKKDREDSSFLGKYENGIACMNRSGIEYPDETNRIDQSFPKDPVHSYHDRLLFSYDDYTEEESKDGSA